MNQEAVTEVMDMNEVSAETQSLVTHLSDRMRQYLWEKAQMIESHGLLKREEKIAWMRDVVFCQLNQYVTAEQSREIGILIAEEAGVDFSSLETMDLLGFEIEEDVGQEQQQNERGPLSEFTPGQKAILRAIQDVIEG